MDHLFLDGTAKSQEYLSLQKSNVWNMIALSAQDQLRQRMAWALSQILVITPHQIDEVGLSEAYLNYYDIFVRNAFGNYRDVLKEVSYSPMMAEMLSFLESKSSGTFLTILYGDFTIVNTPICRISFYFFVLNLQRTS
jgi:uncharacterized protein (DUF1800 family)